jgi:hypothetical protein
MRIICNILNWINDDQLKGDESTLRMIAMVVFVSIVLAALIFPAVMAAHKAAYDAVERPYTTRLEERELKNDLIRARIKWYNTNTEKP